MTDKRYWFYEYRDISAEKCQVERIGGIQLLVYGIDDINIRAYNRKQWETAVLQDKMHIPSIGRN